jgi:hypothetical protein
MLLGLSVKLRSIGKELPFWIFMILSMLGSATLLYMSDGMRSFAITYVLIALFFAMAFTSPPALRSRGCGSRQEGKRGLIGLAVAGSLLIAIPGFGRLMYVPPDLGSVPTLRPDEIVIGGWPRWSGLLVLPDDADLPKEVPAIHYARFAKEIARTQVELSQRLLTPKPPDLPFGFISAPSYATIKGDRPSSMLILIVPPEVLFRREVRAWRLTLVPWYPSDVLFATHWMLASKAEAIEF